MMQMKSWFRPLCLQRYSSYTILSDTALHAQALPLTVSEMSGFVIIGARGFQCRILHGYLTLLRWSAV